MIERYETESMRAIWSREAKYGRWLEVELAICEAHVREGTVPESDMRAIRQQARFDLARCDELELETRHDLAAFVRNLEENVGEAGRWIHFGVTSYDVIDTALGMMLRDSVDQLLEHAAGLHARMRELELDHWAKPMIGRTHGVHAEPITFGWKVQGWRLELERNIERLRAVRKEVAVGKISGAVGVHAHVSPTMEAEICRALGLEPDPHSTQIVNRDRHASFLNTLALLGAGIERVATELRNLQRTEILEVQEAFGSGQTGSSAMPHKRNPWNSETLCGLARVLRGHAMAMLESVATWHERDLTSSSLERIVLPDSCHLADFMILRLEKILAGLEVRDGRMLENLRLMGDLVFSEHLMVALVESGLSRREAYKIAQRNAAKSWEGEDFRKSVEQDPDVRGRLGEDRLIQVFSLHHHLRHLLGSGL